LELDRAALPRAWHRHRQRQLSSAGGSRVSIWSRRGRHLQCGPFHL